MTDPRPSQRQPADVTGGRRLWPDELSDTERRVLRRRDALSAKDRRPDVLVVGGGIMGVATARACEEARTGSVLLVEAEVLGHGATGGALGLCTPEPHHGLDPEPLVVLGRASLGRWRELEATLPGGVGLVDLEWIGLLEDERELVRRSPFAELITAEEMARIVPGLSRRQPAMRIGGQARVNPLRAAARLTTTLRSVSTGVRATSVLVRGGALRSVETTAGRVSPGAVVFATGNPPQLEGLGPQPAADYVKGHLLVTEVAPVSLPGTLDPVATPLEDGRLVVGGSLDEGDDRPSVTRGRIDEMLSDLVRRLPTLDGIRVERAWSCFRPHHVHGLPTIDRVNGLDNAWFTSGHYRTGILMAPATAAILTEWLTTGEQPAHSSAFGLRHRA